ncbi:MAG: 3-methyl-2-oxobutanoate hydroxymethyltransferase, partial [Snowella sp.]
GAGAGCDGQVLVTADLLGLSKKTPPFAKTYLNLRSEINGVIEQFSADVREKRFPEDTH